PVHAVEPGAEAAGERREPRLHALETDRGEQLGRRAETDDPERVQRARLVAVGRERRLVLGLGLAPGPAAEERLELDAGREVEDARPGRPEEALVPGHRHRRRAELGE